MRKNTKFSLEDVHEPTEEEIAAALRIVAGVRSGVEMEDEGSRASYQNPSGFGRPGKYPWGAMRVGDSVSVLPEHLNHEGTPTMKFRANVGVHNSKGKPKHWVVRRTKEEPKQWRLWRVT